MPAGRRKTPVDKTGVLRGVLHGGRLVVTESLGDWLRSTSIQNHFIFRATGQSTVDRPVAAGDKDRRQGSLPRG